MSHATREMLEAQMKVAIKDGHLHPHEVFIALNNVFFHGDIFEDAGLGCSQETLAQLYDGIETSCEAMKKVDG